MVGLIITGIFILLIILALIVPIQFGIALWITNTKVKIWAEWSWLGVTLFTIKAGLSVRISPLYILAFIGKKQIIIKGGKIERFGKTRTDPKPKHRKISVKLTSIMHSLQIKCIEGRFEVGTGDAASTALLCGLIKSLLLVLCPSKQELVILPDFGHSGIHGHMCIHTQLPIPQIISSIRIRPKSKGASKCQTKPSKKSYPQPLKTSAI